MTDDELLARIEQKVAASETRFPRATLAAVRDAEARLGFALPSLYVRLLTEVANGGFGPEDGIMGLPPDGFTDRDVQGSVVDAYFEGLQIDVVQYAPEPLHFLRFHYDDGPEDQHVLVDNGSVATSAELARAWVEEEFQVEPIAWRFPS